MRKLLLRIDHPEDFDALPLGLRRRMLRFVLALQYRPYRGTLLESRRFEGFADCRDLGGCWKLKCHDARAVYKLLPNDQAPRTVWIIAVGRRADDAAYALAFQRLQETR